MQRRESTMLKRALTPHIMWAFLVVVVAACSISAPLPPTSIPLTPPAVFARWWSMTEACSGRAGSLSAVTWYQVPHVPQFENGGTAVGGYWTSNGNRIVLAGDLVLSGSVVRHEMLHALLRERGHPAGEFLGQCGGVVDCDEVCVRDGGTIPLASNPVTVDADSVEVGVTLDPVAPRSTVDDGFFVVTVTARNTSATPIIVSLPGGERPQTFWFDLRGPEGGTIDGVFALSPSSVNFQPYEIKRQVFDFAIGHDLWSRRMPPGTYQVRGGYGPHGTGTLVAEIGP